MNNQPEQLFAALKEQRLTPTEKASTRHMLAVFASSYMPVSQPWYRWGTFVRHHVAASVAVLILMLAGSVSTLAQYSLPGDTLYPVKVTVTDKIAAVATINEDVKLELELNQIERSLDEEEVAGQLELQL